MKQLKIFALAVLAAGALFMSYSCSDGGPDDEAENILIIEGQTYKVAHALYFHEPGSSEYRIDLDTEEFGTKEEPDMIHGYGDFTFDGKDITIDVTKHEPLYISGFNWNAGGFYQAGPYKSGTQTIKNGKNGTIILIIDCKDMKDQRVYLNVAAQDEESFNRSQQ